MPRTITVSGEALVNVVPDEVEIRLGVETWDENLHAAKRRNDATVKEIVAVAREHGVDSRYIQTDYMGIEPYYSGDTIQPKTLGYWVRKSIVITLKDLPEFEALLADAVAAGATHVHGIDFRTTALRQHRDTARALAIQAAREKATAMAKALGEEIGAPTSIQEQYYGWYSWYDYYGWWGSGYGRGMSQNVMQESGGGGELPEGSLAPGQIGIRSTVSVTFELQ
jgi:uncharacterized protein YggE